MLRAALAIVHETGLTVSLEHIGFEDLFFSDLVLELATDPVPGIFGDEMNLTRRIVAGRLDELADPRARRALLIELFRQLAVLDFDACTPRRAGAPTWRCTPPSSAWAPSPPRSSNPTPEFIGDSQRAGALHGALTAPDLSAQSRGGATAPSE